MMINQGRLSAFAADLAGLMSQHKVEGVSCYIIFSSDKSGVFFPSLLTQHYAGNDEIVPILGIMELIIREAATELIGGKIIGEQRRTIDADPNKTN